MHHNSINKLVLILRFIGIWPVESTVRSYKLLNLIFRLFNLTIIVLLMLLTIADAIANFNDMSLITDNLCFFVGCTEALTKGLKYCFEYKNIVKLINDIYRPIDIINNKNNIEVMKVIKETARFEHRQFVFVIGTLTLLYFARVLGADFKNKEFPIRALFPFDATVSPYYHLIYLLITYGVFLVDYSIFGVDMVVVVIMRYLTIQIDILRANCRHCDIKSTGRNIVINSYDDKNNEGTEIHNFVEFELQHEDIDNDDSFDKRLKKCIIQHHKIIRMLTLLNGCFSFCVVVQIMSTTAFICLNGFQIIAGNDIHLLMRRILASMAAIIQLSFWCWYGNKLSAAADSLTMNFWMCGWEDNYKHGLRNFMSIPMTLSLRSLELRAIGVVPLSLQTFVSAMKTSYSVLILLLTVAKD
ncbi:odorant receptor 13a-like [Microplitis mediator]|uniref:odorant receptor 13a-like n=1 Tax=Microplitis mediator TaxID=375433 RepID=UPI0025573D77|nr:odorant receptor 13a-like [Microplitis mediator]